MTGQNVSAHLPDSAAALDFLNRFEPDGPWVLTAIRPDRKSIETLTFYPSTTERMLEWLTIVNGTWNIYFHVNRPLRDLNKKAEREDIKEVAWLHVDVDPRAGEDLSSEQARLLKIFTENRPAEIPAPTVLIFSGGGYQGFWRLRKPIEINGSIALAEDAKRYNQMLERAFQADNCHNIDRIMRLPGTINVSAQLPPWCGE